MTEAPISPIDMLDILAVILGIIYSLRRQWVARRDVEDFPGVEEALFTRWKAAARKAYALLANACFAKLILDLLWFYGGPRLGVAGEVQRYVAMSIDVSWLVALAWGLTLRGRAARLRRLLPPPREAS